ncbi:MAG: hypothetical protein QMD85_01520 [Candidatus Aenigmarchaeota archaeon]|nr:hypothetical protein [Candidatus Aenigmarchaeota archaeon]MDI6722218.1 hypothetical protein [Candidatus Aenigmarchaeota archaeon]
MPRKILRKLKKPLKKETVKCIRCEKMFPTVNALKVHNRSHLQKMKEMSMLEEGKVPSESKIGHGFKGKNRIVIA